MLSACCCYLYQFARLACNNNGIMNSFISFLRGQSANPIMSVGSWKIGISTPKAGSY